jgi:competence protein ComEC
MLKNLFSKSFGPEIVIPILFIAFLIGHEFIPSSLSNWKMGMFCYLFLLTLICIYLKKIGSCLVLPIFICLQFILGYTAIETPLPAQKESSQVYRILALKQTHANFIQAIGQRYVLSKGNIYPTNEQTVCLMNKKSGITHGDLIFSEIPSEAIKNSGNPGSFNIESYYLTKGIQRQCLMYQSYIKIGHIEPSDIWIHTIRNWFEHSFEQRLRGSSLGLAKALLLGNTSEVSQSSKQSFSATGAIHVLAVSGMHIALFAALLLYGFGLFPRLIPRYSAIIFTLIVLWCYAWLTGFSPSIMRSVAMFTLIQIGQIVQRTASPNHILLWCAYLMYLFDPACIYDIGFQLSFGAVYGIQTYKDRIASLWTPTAKSLKFVWEHSSIALAAQLFTTPLILYYFHTFPNYFLIANLGIVILSGFVMYVGFGFLLLGWVPLLGSILGFIFSLSLNVMDSFISIIAQIPGSVEGGFSLTHWQLLIVFAILIWIFHGKAPRWSKFTIGILLLAGISFKRCINQTETHLLILKAKYPMLIYKNNTRVTLFSDAFNSQKSIKRILYDYQKIYPYQHVQIRILENNSSINIKQSEIQLSHYELVVKGKHPYRIEFKPNGTWMLHTLDKKTQAITPETKLCY